MTPVDTVSVLGKDGIFMVQMPTVRVCHFSPCRKWRYSLKVTWDDSLPFQVFICLNPSTADESKNDPTVKRCIQFSIDWGRGGFCMLNLFAWRDTKPEKMKIQPDPIGPENTVEYLRRVVAESGCTPVAAWGKHGTHLGRAAEVMAGLDKLDALRLNLDGTPEHPLYIPAITLPQPYNYSV